MILRTASLATLVLSLAMSAWGDLSLLGPDRKAPTIVLSPNAEDQERYAADDLKKYLSRMTGQEVVIGDQPETGSVAIQIGRVPANQELESVVKEKDLGRDGFVLDVTASGVRILGGSKFGTSYGVYELLERLGVRWLFPGEWGEVVPKGSTLRLPEGRFTDKPVFNIRQMHIAHVKGDAGDWFRRVRHNRSGYFGHSNLVNPKKHGALHPEWFAEIDGVRRVDDPNYKLCHSNDAMVAQAIEETLKSISARRADSKVKRHIGYPHLTEDYSIISISPTDGGGFCRCKECLAVGSISDRLQIFANKVAAAVRAEYPEMSVGYYGAYSEAQMPPTVTAEPGVVIFATTWTRNFFNPLSALSNATYRNKIEEFSKVCPEIVMRDFDGLSVWWGFGPFTLADVHAPDYDWYHQHGIKGIVTEAQNAWGPWGYSYYLTSKLMWNPKADREALKRDFVKSGYAEAYEPMARYYQKLDKAVSYPPADLLYSMRQDLEVAARIVTSPDAKTRIDALRAHFAVSDIIDRYRAGTTSQEELDKALRAVKSIDPHVSPYTARALRRLGLEADPNSTEILPLSPDELGDFLAAVELKEPGKTFTPWPGHNDLRLAPLISSAADFTPGMKINFRYGPTTLLIYAKSGERLKVTQSSKRRDTFNTVYELRDPDLAVVEEGIANGAVILDRPSSGDGIYTLTINTGGWYPEIEVENRWAVVKASSAAERVHPMGAARNLYFYVPKGTNEFAISSKAYEPLGIEVFGPDDAPVHHPKIQQVSHNYEEHRFTVPNGTDGKPWRVSFTGGKKDIFLLGVPPYLASDPNRLLIVEDTH